MTLPFSAPPNWLEPPDTGPGRDALELLKRLPHTKGPLALEGARLGDTWMEWQELLTRHLFGTLNGDGTRRYRTVYVEMPKKAGKSTYAAGLALLVLTIDDEFGAEVLSVGYHKDQAKIVWQIAADMVDLDAKAQGAPAGLDDMLDVVEYLSRIECPELNSVYAPISRESRGRHGVNPSTVIFDELHTQPSRELFDTVRDSMVARRQPLLFAITNAGVDRQSICYEQREYAIAVNEGRIEDPTFLGLIFAADPEADWTEESTWRSANPGIGCTVPVEAVAQRCKAAQEQPSAQNSFKRWYLSLWTEQVTRWLDPEDWAAAAREIDWSEYVGRTCYGGLDLGSVSDLTAWVLAFPDREDPETLTFRCRAWCPEARLTDPDNTYRAQYQAWARDGWLETTPGKVTDYRAVRAQIVADAESYGLVDMAMDRAFQGNQMAVELLEDDGITVAGMGTGMISMSSPCAELERRLLMEPPRILHDGNPVLAWAVGNVALKLGRDESKRMPVKDAQAAKIDPVVAALMALDRAMRHEDNAERPSKYETEELLVL